MTVRGRLRRLVVAVVLVVGLAAGVTACAPQPGSIEIDADTVVLDVRTAAEYAQGHLEGAVNIDVQGGTFDAEMGGLDPDATYVVYCRTGNRSAAAIARMTELGFDSLINAGSLSAASTATGLPIVD